MNQTRMMLGVLVLSTMLGCSTLEEIVAHAGRDLTRDREATPRRAPPGPAPQSPSPSRHLAVSPPPIFGDWWYKVPDSMRLASKPKTGNPCDALTQIEYRTPATYLPVNCPGGMHGGPSFVPTANKSWYAKCLAEELDRLGAPVAVLIRERNCPFPFNTGGNPTSPGEVAQMLDALPKLDYLLMDLEPYGEGTPADVVRNVEEIVRLVRSHPNPRVADAYLGNYDDWPGKTDEWRIFPKTRDRTRSWRDGSWNRDAFYRENLNVAMPPVYPHRVHSRHTHAGVQRGPVAPNNRAAMFWAPLARLSEASRHLPDGHLLIPWITNYGTKDEHNKHYNAPPPPRADLEALVRHIRMRGAHSYFIWTSNPTQTSHPTINHESFKTLAMDAWRTLDPLFESGDEPRVLNLDTEKASGVQWSGIASGERVWVLVSNLGQEDGVTVDLPDLPGVPDRSPPVPRNAHRLFRWRLDG